MAWDWSKIGKFALIGGGTVLSLFNPALGAPLIVAGSAINTKTSTTSTDTVSTYAANLNAALTTAAGMQTTGTATLTVSKWFNWITANLPLILIGLLGLFLVPKLLKRR